MNLRAWTIVALTVGLGAAFPTLATAPPGWLIGGNAPGDYQFELDTSTAASGTRSAMISAKHGARADGFGTLMQTIAADDYRGTRLRLSAYLRTQAANRAQMWMRVDGSDGRILGFDNMDSRPVTGTTGWRRYEIVLDVPSDSTDLAFGFLLISSGKVWADDFKLEKVDTSVAITSAGLTLPRVPANLDFEDTAPGEAAVWTARKLRMPIIVQPSYGDWENCHVLYEDVKEVLLKLGARASDLTVKGTGCPARLSGIEATFSVLAPANVTGRGTIGPSVSGSWRTVEIRFDVLPRDQIPTGSRVDRTMPLGRQQLWAQMVKQNILPLFPAKDAQFNDSTSLRVQVLKPQ